MLAAKQPFGTEWMSVARQIGQFWNALTLRELMSCQGKPAQSFKCKMSPSIDYVRDDFKDKGSKMSNSL